MRYRNLLVENNPGEFDMVLKNKTMKEKQSF